jgi:hypothetical protein
MDYLEFIKKLLDKGADVNARRRMMLGRRAKLDMRDYGMTDNDAGPTAVHTWQPVDDADGLVRVGVQSVVAHPEAGLLLRKLMTERGSKHRRCVALLLRSASLQSATSKPTTRATSARSTARPTQAQPSPLTAGLFVLSL